MKSSSENPSHERSNHQNYHAINPQDPNLFVRSTTNNRIPLSDVVDNQMIDNDSAESYNEHNESKRKKYVCKVCGEVGHNARNKLKCKQQE